MKKKAVMLKKQFCFALVLAFLTVSVLAQGLPQTRPERVGLSSEKLGRIDKVIEKSIDGEKIAGAVAIVARKGKVAYLKSFGMMDMEAKKPMHVNTIFRIASMTKPITSLAVMMLYEEGHFLLNDPVSKFIPEFKGAHVLVPKSMEETTSSGVTTVPAEQEITILHLLTHTSGLTYQWNQQLGEIYNNAGITHGLIQDEGTIGGKMKILADLPLLHDPGERWEYGLSIDVLGYLVEVVSGKTLDEFFQERIFKPLGMKDTYFFISEENFSRLAAVYASNQEGGISRLPEDPVVEGTLIYSASYPYSGPERYFSGGGGLCSTISDYLQFLQMMLNGGELDGVRLLSRKTVELMTVDHVKELNDDFGFGLGFGITRDLGESGEIGSVGAYSWGGFYYTTFWVDPEEEMIGILMSQLHPSGGLRLLEKFRVLAYQAIID